MYSKTIYYSDDGRPFENESDCIGYEQSRENVYRIIQTDVKATNLSGDWISTKDKDWFDKAHTIRINSRKAAAALAHVMSDENESYYDIYHPDFAETIQDDATRANMLTYMYLVEDIQSADNPNSRMTEGWYNVDSILTNMQIEMLFVDDI